MYTVVLRLSCEASFMGFNKNNSNQGAAYFLGNMDYCNNNFG
jgi:hypothetical protein